MISKNLKIGTKVFNLNSGFGHFLGWHNENLEIAIVKFEHSMSGTVEYLKRKDLNEVIGE